MAGKGDRITRFSVTAQVGVITTDGVTPQLPMRNRDGSTIMCGNQSSFWPGYDVSSLVCIDADDCVSDPCLNGATCVDNGYKVYCLSLFHCDSCCR